jgi:hypothetical protein
VGVFSFVAALAIDDLAGGLLALLAVILGIWQVIFGLMEITLA